MKIILIVGRKKSGKTTLTKNRFSHLPNFCVVDVHNEYDHLPISDIPKPGSRIITSDVNRVISEAARSKGLTFAIEDATIWLNQRTSDLSLKNLIISCRHNKNVVVFLFHSLNRVPLFLLEQADILYLFETKETRATWSKIDDPDIIAAHDRLKKLNKKYSYEFVEL